jgi:predicted PurR-regulated permease PerM
MTVKQPFYIRSTVILFGLILLIVSLYYLADILVPLTFAGMIAILLNPLCNWLLNKKIPRILAIAICLLAAIVVFGSIGYFVSSQLANFLTEMPLLKKKGLELLTSLQTEIDQQLGINIANQNKWLSNLSSKLEPMAGSALSGLFGSLSVLLLLPVYTYLFLYYKNLLLNFLYEIFADTHSNEVATVLTQTKQAMQNYMSGLLLEALIVAMLNSAALMILGVKYALLIGVLGALLNMLPYIGGIIAIALPLLMATITKDGYDTHIWIVVSYLIIQFIDNNLLMPYIVSSKVKINALVSIIIILMGGALWGVSGMFLSIPIIGLIKIIFDRIPELKPWGKLLGTEMPTKAPGKFRRKLVKPKVTT